MAVKLRLPEVVETLNELWSDATQVTAHSRSPGWGTKPPPRGVRNRFPCN
jgi:hypothetical protein